MMHIIPRENDSVFEVVYIRLLILLNVPEIHNQYLIINKAVARWLLPLPLKRSGWRQLATGWQHHGVSHRDRHIFMLWE